MPHLKLNRQAKLRVYTTHTVSPTFVDQRIIRLLGREVPTPQHTFML